ncbi:MAG: 8-oxo-dGTP diphosphatase [Acidimicrobiaceae bacterium]|nr:8-oxo-dGTP diphosphatase [Acidimicrobiaceae bacterium]
MVTEEPSFEIPTIPASAGALLFDRDDRLLIVKPNYKSGWTIPGGMMEADGETPWEACRREVVEETGLIVETGRLVIVDFLRPRGHKRGGMRFLFDCGGFDDSFFDHIALQAEEISAYQLAARATALDLLSGPLRRRVSASFDTDGCGYLEDGLPVSGVGTKSGFASASRGLEHADQFDVLGHGEQVEGP